MTLDDLMGPPELQAPASLEGANLRAAADPTQSCAGCAHFQGEGQPCAQGLPAAPQLVCDLFAPPQGGDLESLLFG